jgi:hypothetical protein
MPCGCVSGNPQSLSAYHLRAGSLNNGRAPLVDVERRRVLFLCSSCRAYIGLLPCPACVPLSLSPWVSTVSLFAVCCAVIRALIALCPASARTMVAASAPASSAAIRCGHTSDQFWIMLISTILFLGASWCNCG